MVANPQLWLLGLAQMATFGLVIVVGAWVTTYLSKSFDLSLKTAGRIGSLVLLTGIATRALGAGALVPLWRRLTLQVSLAMNIAACLNFRVGKQIVIVGGHRDDCYWESAADCPTPTILNRAAALYPARPGAAIGIMNTLGTSMILTPRL